MDSSSPDIDAANLNNIETGISKAPYGPDATANKVAIADGAGGWTYAQVANTQIASAAAIAYSKLALTGSIVNADIATGAALAYAKLNLAAAIKDSDIATSQNLSKLAAVTGTPTGSKFLRDDGTWNLPVGLTTYRVDAPVVVNNTVVETNLVNQTIAANPGVSALLRLTAWGDLLGNNGLQAANQWKLKFGGVTLIDTAAGAATLRYTGAATRYPFQIVALIKNQGAANSQIVSFKLDYISQMTNIGPLAFATGEGVTEGYNGTAGAAQNIFGQGFNTGAVDTTSGQALVLSVTQGNASVNVETKLYGAVVEVI